MTISRWLQGLAVIALLLWASPAAAQNCNISTTSLNFGSYDVFSSSPTDSTSTLTIRCNQNLPITVFISQGGSTTFTERLMTTTGDQIGYNLYLDAARTLVWGDSTAGTSIYSGNAPRNVNVVLTVYGRTPAGQDVSAGAYTDTVTATVNY